MNLENLRDLFTAAENIAAHLDGPLPDIVPREASAVLLALLSAMRRELKIDDCGVAGCDCNQANIVAVDLPQAGVRMAREEGSGGSVSVLGLLLGGLVGNYEPAPGTGVEL